MKTKTIIVGASTVGKTTLLKHLREIIHSPIDEADNLLTEMNGGTYPHDKEYKMTTLAPKMVNDILHRDSIIFFTNTDYFTIEDLEKARSNGFKILQLTIPRQEMEKRNKYRIEHEGYDDLSRYFDIMLAYQYEINDKGLVDKEIDTNQSIKKIVDELIQQLACKAE